MHTVASEVRSEVGTEPQTTPRKIFWKWSGPKVEVIGRSTILWTWEAEGFGYKVLRVHPPFLPVQYSLAGPKSEWTCSYVGELNAAMRSCEKHYRENQENKIFVSSNRLEMIWMEKKALALLDPSTLPEEALFFSGQQVPISWFPLETLFLLKEENGNELRGVVIGTNSDWTVQVWLEGHLSCSLPMDRLVSVVSTCMLRRRTQMQVSERDARDLFISLGYKAADDEKIWTGKKLVAKLNRLPEFLKEVDEISNERMHALATGVCRALQDGASIVLVQGLGTGSENVSQNGTENGTRSENGSVLAKESVTMSVTATLEKDQTAQGSASDGTQAAKPAKERKPRAPKKEKPEKEKANLDQYGCRVGSENAKLNLALSKDKPKTMAQLVQEAGLKRGLYGHIKAMMKKGHVKETKEGENRLYSLTH